MLTRNPNYHGSRPHRLARIELRSESPPSAPSPRCRRAPPTTPRRRSDQVRTSPRSPLATAREAPPPKAATSSSSSTRDPQLDFLALNTHRPLFADCRLRQAVNYAIDRTAMARLGDGFAPLPEHPTDHYLPPGIPGYRNMHIYPFTPDVAKARQLANGHPPATAVLYTCDVSPCDQQAQIIKTDLAAIGLRVEVKAFADSIPTPSSPRPASRSTSPGSAGWPTTWIRPPS